MFALFSDVKTANEIEIGALVCYMSAMPDPTMMRIAACDPSYTNMGLGRFMVDAVTRCVVSVEALELHTTVKGKAKGVSVAKDDLRRSLAQILAYGAAIKGCDLCFAEMPYGAQSARGAFGNGVVTAIIAGSSIPVIPVTPLQVKLATVGSKTASKEDVISWAMAKYPDAPWIRLRGKISPTNEHLADACGALEAGLATEDFQRFCDKM